MDTLTRSYHVGLVTLRSGDESRADIDADALSSSKQAGLESEFRERAGLIPAPRGRRLRIRLARDAIGSKSCAGLEPQTSAACAPPDSCLASRAWEHKHNLTHRHLGRRLERADICFRLRSMALGSRVYRGRSDRVRLPVGDD